MTKKEFDQLMALENQLMALENQLMALEKRDLIIEIWNLQNRVADLEKQNIEMGWRINPDRMGGQFTREEIERNWDGWS